MTAEEKKVAFEFLSFASAYISGNSRKACGGSSFSDDEEVVAPCDFDVFKFGEGARKPFCLAVSRAKSGEAKALAKKMLSTISLFPEKNVFLADADLLDAESGSLECLFAALRPKAVIFLQEGKFARGKIFRFAGIPAAATFEADTLLRDSSLKRSAWSDLKFFRETLLSIDPEYERAQEGG